MKCRESKYKPHAADRDYLGAKEARISRTSSSQSHEIRATSFFVLPQLQPQPWFFNQLLTRGCEELDVSRNINKSFWSKSHWLPPFWWRWSPQPWLLSLLRWKWRTGRDLPLRALMIWRRRLRDRLSTELARHPLILTCHGKMTWRWVSHDSPVLFLPSAFPVNTHALELESSDRLSDRCDCYNFSGGFFCSTC